MAQNYVLLERIELNASAASVSFLNIPQSGYTDLKVVISARGTASGVGGGNLLSINGSSGGTNFTCKLLQGNGGIAASGSPTNFVGDIPLASVTASTFGNIEITFPNYTSSNYKSYSIDSVTENNATGTDSAYADLAAGLWSQTTAISSLGFYQSSGSFVQYSTFSLYALAAVGTTPAIAPKASGGNITTDGTYWYHTFLATNTFTPFTNLTCDALVVAGGGVGGSGGAGSGGAGGLSYQAGRSVPATSYTVTVGAGGATGTNGGNSVFDTITSNGGGYGGNEGFAGGNGGSGGSGGGVSLSGGSANQGNTGGATGYGNNPGTTNTYSSGGGGGAGAAGSNASSNNQGGNGGNGLNTWSSWATATGTGDSGYYAGGAGGNSNNGTQTSGGLGGGGKGAVYAATTSATGGATNTGGGGGGGNYGTHTGGSGIIIIRYAMA